MKHNHLTVLTCSHWVLQLCW